MSFLFLVFILSPYDFNFFGGEFQSSTLEMEGKRGPVNTAYDYSSFNPQQNSQKYRSYNNYKRESELQHCRREHENYSPSQNSMEPPKRGSPERQLSPSPRHHMDYHLYNQLKRQTFDQTEGAEFQYANRNPQQAEPGAVHEPLNSCQHYEDYEQNDGRESENEGDYKIYEDNEDEYYRIGDCARSEANKGGYDELNQVLDEGDYVSIIDDHYSTDEGEYFGEYGHRDDYSQQSESGRGGTYGEPFDPACYGSERTYHNSSEEQYEPTYYSASQIQTASQEQSFRNRFQNYQPNNPESSSCPVLQSKSQQKRKDIFKQVSKKINETVTELKNAGIEENSNRIRCSNPDVDYIRRYNKNVIGVNSTKEKAFQPRQAPRMNSEKPQFQTSRKEEIQRKMQEQQFYRQTLQKRRLQEMNTGSQNSQRSSQIQDRGKTQSPSNEAIHRKMIQQLHGENGNFTSSRKQNQESVYNYYQLQEQERPIRDGRSMMPQQFSDFNRKKTDGQMPDSFVQQHAVNDQTVPDCCRQEYVEFKKSSPVEE